MSELTTKDALLERMVEETEKLATNLPAKFGEYLPLSGGTMTGGVTFNATGNEPIKTLIKGKYQDIQFLDADGVNRVGTIRAMCYKSDKYNSVLLGTHRYGTNGSPVGIGVLCYEDGRTSTSAPTPVKTSNDTNIATTAFVKTNLADYLPLSGGTMTGNISFNKSDARIYVSKAGDDSSLMLAGGAGVTTGAYINLFGQSHATNAGEVAIISRDTSNTSDMRMKPDGTLMWKSQAILYGPNVSYNNNGYFIIRSCNTAIQWRRGNIGAGASYTWTFDRPFGADNQYTRFVSSENACTVTATATTMTVTNNGSTAAEVNMLAIGIMAQ